MFSTHQGLMLVYVMECTTITSFILFWENKTLKRTSSKTLGALPVFIQQLNSVSFIRVWPAKCALTFAHQLVMQFWNIMHQPTFPIMPRLVYVACVAFCFLLIFCCCFHGRVWSKHCGFCELGFSADCSGLLLSVRAAFQYWETTDKVKLMSITVLSVLK